MRRIVFSLVVAGALGACGGVELLSIHDGRLPIESRRWVADAEDAVSVANAYLQEAEAKHRRTSKLVDELEGQAKRISKAGGMQPSSKMLVMAKAQMAYVDLIVEHAEAELALAKAKQLLVNAETAMRHDINVYELEPLEEEVEKAREISVKLRRKVLSASLAAHKTSGQSWQTYAGWVKGGGDNKAFWLLAEERKIKKPKKKAKAPAPKADTKPAPAPAPKPPAPAPK